VKGGYPGGGCADWAVYINRGGYFRSSIYSPKITQPTPTKIMMEEGGKWQRKLQNSVIFTYVN